MDGQFNCCIVIACSTGDVRLRGGMNHLEGRVEYCVNNQWGTVCSEGWSDGSTAVVCVQLGFNRAGESSLFCDCIIIIVIITLCSF